MVEQKQGIGSRLRKKLKKTEEKNTLSNPIQQLALGYVPLLIGILFIGLWLFVGTNLYVPIVGVLCLLFGYIVSHRKVRVLVNLKNDRREELGYEGQPKVEDKSSNALVARIQIPLIEYVELRPVFTLTVFFMAIAIGIITILIGLMLSYGFNVEGILAIFFGYYLVKYGYSSVRQSARKLIYS